MPKITKDDHAPDATMADDAATTMVTVNIPAGLRATAHGADVHVAGLPTASIVYLLLNGFSQSMTDAGTTAAAKAKSAAVKAANEERGTGNHMTKAETDAFLATDTIKEMVEAAAESARTKRVAAIWEGSMVYGSRGANGPRRTPKEAFIWGLAEADAKAASARKGKPMPKGEELETLLQGIIDRKRADYEARYAATGADDDLDDLI